ncbi:MAG: MFS transporter [Clostridia bacterium]
MLAKVMDILYRVKTYWRKPPKGYEVTYKEFVYYALGFGGTSFLSVLCTWTGIATTTYMMISHFKISTGVVFFLGTVLGSICGLLRAPILSMIIDNKNDKKKRGKFKQFLIAPSICWALFFGLIPFIPARWADIELFSITIPAIPIMGLYESQTSVFSLAVIVMFVMLQIGTFFQTMVNQAMAGIEQTISSVAQERANFISIRGLISNIPGSVINALMPIVAGILFADSGHQLNINLYRIFFPICMVLGVGCVLFTYFGVKERVVVSQNFVHRVKFLEGAKELSQNKYFWIITIFNVFAGLRGVANITNWICQFSFESATAKTIANLYCTTLLMNAYIVGAVASPFLIKKYGKRKIMLVSGAGFAAMILFQLLVYKNPYLVLFASFCQNLFGGFYFISSIMASDVLDYQQWKTGKRLEGFWQNYSAFITTIIGVFTGMLTPLFLSFAGIGFGDDLNTALLNPTLRDNAYFYQTLLGLIGSVVCAIPLFFYDLTEEKHADYVRVLKLRAAAENFRDGILTDRDYLNVKEILDYANEKSDAFLLEEIQKHNCLDEIYSGADAVAVKVAGEEMQADLLNFSHDIELEFKRAEEKVQKLRAKAEKSGKPFDEAGARSKVTAKMQYLRYFSRDEFKDYQTFDAVNDHLQQVYEQIREM